MAQRGEGRALGVLPAHDDNDDNCVTLNEDEGRSKVLVLRSDLARFGGLTHQLKMKNCQI